MDSLETTSQRPESRNIFTGDVETSMMNHVKNTIDSIVRIAERNLDAKNEIASLLAKAAERLADQDNHKKG